MRLTSCKPCTKSEDSRLSRFDHEPSHAGGERQTLGRSDGGRLWVGGRWLVAEFLSTKQGEANKIQGPSWVVFVSSGPLSYTFRCFSV